MSSKPSPACRLAASPSSPRGRGFIWKMSSNLHTLLTTPRAILRLRIIQKHRGLYMANLPPPTAEQLRPFNANFQQEIELSRLTGADVDAITRAARANNITPAELDKVQLPVGYDPEKRPLAEILKDPKSPETQSFLALSRGAPASSITGRALPDWAWRGMEGAHGGYGRDPSLESGHQGGGGGRTR